MPVGDGEKPLEEFSRFRLRPGREVDELHEQPGAAAAGAPHAFDEAPQAGQKTIVADAQQRPARHVANAGGLDHNGAGRAAREPFVPVDDVVGGVALFGRPPWNHGRHPGALLKLYRTNLDRRKQQRRCSLRRRRHTAGGCGITDALRWSPHGLKCFVKGLREGQIMPTE